MIDSACPLHAGAIKSPPRPIRVMHVLDALLLAGMEYGVIKITNRLPEAIEPSICCLDYQADATRSIVHSRVRVLTLGRRTRHNYPLIFTLANVFRNNRIDVVHSHNWQTYLYASLAARLARVPILIHGEHGHDDLAAARRRLWIKRRLAPLVTQFVTVSEDLAGELQETWNIPRDRIRTIPNGVELPAVAPEPGVDVRRELGLAPEHEVVISVGGVRRVKDYSTLIRAFARVHATRADTRLVIVGADCDPELHEELARLASMLGVQEAIRFTGLRLDIYRLLGAADVYVNSSIFEGMSNTILEAMAMRRPVVATRAGGNVELIEDGRTGFLVPPRDPETMAQRIDLLLSDPGRRRAIGDQARAYVESRHSMDRMIQSYTELYENCFDRWSQGGHRGVARTNPEASISRD